MTTLESLAKAVGSFRYARDLLERRPVLTQPWWSPPLRVKSPTPSNPERERVIHAHQSPKE
jgi:hypothetical protein